MITFECLSCEHQIIANERPSPIRWSDGHVCKFVEMFECELCGALKPVSEKEHLWGPYKAEKQYDVCRRCKADPHVD